MVFYALTFARSWGRCCKPRPKAELFNISRGTWQTLMHWKTMFKAMVVYRDFFQSPAVFHKFLNHFHKHFHSMSPALSFFSQYPNLHNSYVNCFIDSFNCKRDASIGLMEYCPESCIWKVKYLCFNGTWNSLLIHGFSLVNAPLLKAFGTAFYAIILNQRWFSVNSVSRLQWKFTCTGFTVFAQNHSDSETASFPPIQK